MQVNRYKVRFLTPAFLGNAEQNGQWRTPPFKHLLREWWRVAWAGEHEWSNDIDGLRQAEGALFGSAADGKGNRSRLRLRLGNWENGRLKSWDGSGVGTVYHPEVSRVVGADLYLGFGPLLHKGKTVLKANAAIQAAESEELRLACPNTDARLVDRALALMDRFGTIGGRSRNGWGSFLLEDAPGLDRPPLRDWRDCLDRDWPHALGQDEKGALIWQTESFDDWRQIMRRLAEIKIGFRTKFDFPTERTPHSRVQERHWLAYPVTHHGTRAWDRNARLPNSLRFKVVEDEKGKLRGRIFHVPCRPPRQFKPDDSALERVWQRVHDYLDKTEGLERANP